MYHRAIFFRNKFTRNSIGLLVIMLLIFLTPVEVSVWLYVVFSLFLIIYVALAYWINLKLKQKVTEKNIEFDKGGYEKKEGALTFALIIVLFLGFRHFKYADLLATIVGLAYAYWLISEMKILSIYFKH